jgi:hypothetical protein
MVIFAADRAAPGERVALEQCEVDRAARVVYIRRSFGKGRPKSTKTEASVRALRYKRSISPRATSCPRAAYEATCFAAIRRCPRPLSGLTVQRESVFLFA